jgi:hypothetical protein
MWGGNVSQALIRKAKSGSSGGATAPVSAPREMAERRNSFSVQQVA